MVLPDLPNSDISRTVAVAIMVLAFSMSSD